MNRSQDHVSIQYLKELMLLQQLPVPTLQRLAQQNPCRHVLAGRPIFHRGQADTEVIYLVKGKVSLTGQQHSEIVSAGTSAARVPLDHHLPRRCDATALSDVVLFCLNQNLIDIITEDRQSATAIAIEEISADDRVISNRLMYQLYQDYMRGQLKLTSLPELALRVRRAVQDPGKSAQDIAIIVQSDPSVTGQLIRIANSPLYRAESRIVDCQTAIARVGLENTRDIVTGLCIRQLFKPKTKLVARQMSALWKHSTHVAAIASVIASMLPAIKADRALLAGLIHDIGILAILSYAEQFPALAGDSSLLEETITHLRAPMGALVLRYWGLPSDLVTVALEAENWHRDSEQGPDLCDVVQVAQIFSFIGSDDQTGKPGLYDLPAFSKLPLCRQGHEKGLEILREAHEQIQDMKHMLI